MNSALVQAIKQRPLVGLITLLGALEGVELVVAFAIRLYRHHSF